MESAAGDAILCRRCGYRYTSSARGEDQRRRALLVMLLRHWALVHGEAPDRLLNEVPSAGLTHLARVREQADPRTNQDGRPPLEPSAVGRVHG